MKTKTKNLVRQLEEDQSVLQAVFGEADLDAKKLMLLKTHLQNMQNNIDSILKILDQNHKVQSDDFVTESFANDISEFLPTETEDEDQEDQANAQVVEGVFDGETMIASDGRKFIVPANYASKSKLVEGDILKLLIDNRGNFKFKQIGPIERRRFYGRLYQDKHTLQYFAVFKNNKWKVLTASVTYFQGDTGDEVIFVTPKNSVSKWAAVENIIKNTGAPSELAPLRQYICETDFMESPDFGLPDNSAWESKALRDLFEEALAKIDAERGGN